MGKWICTLALIAASGAHATGAKFSDEAMQLAAQHFNRDGGKLMEFGSPEHELMRTALVKISAQQGLSPKPAPFAIQEFHSTLLKMGARDEVYDKQVNTFSSLVKGCVARGDGKSKAYVLDKKCESPSAQNLGAMGFTTLEGEFRKATPEMGADSLVLQLAHKRKADLRYFTGRLEEMSELKALFGESLKKAGGHAKDGGTTGLLESSGNAGLDAPFKLQFQKGREFVVVTVTPVKRKKGYDVEISDVNKTEHRSETAGEERG